MDEKVREIEVVKKHPLFKAVYERTISQAKTIRTLLSRIKELEEQVLRMIRGDFKQICSYCGWESKMGDWKALENHVREECFSHPLRQANARIRELEEGIKELIAYVDIPVHVEGALQELIEKEKS